MSVNLTPGSIVCPLREIHSYDPNFKVETYLHEPTWRGQISFEEVSMEMLALCIQLESLCNKQHAKIKKDKSSNIPSGYQSKFEPQAGVFIEKLKEQLTILSKDSLTLMGHFQQSGLAVMFPKSFSYITNPQSAFTDASESPMADYLDHTSILNKLVSISEQLNSDISNLTNHKYIAHQLAILYNTVNQPGSPMAKYKQAIEEIFNAVKTTIGNTPKETEPTLKPEEKQAIFSITSGIIQEVEQMNMQNVNEMQPVVNYLHQQQQQQYNNQIYGSYVTPTYSNQQAFQPPMTMTY